MHARTLLVYLFPPLLQPHKEMQDLSSHGQQVLIFSDGGPLARKISVVLEEGCVHYILSSASLSERLCFGVVGAHLGGHPPVRLPRWVKGFVLARLALT